MHLPSPGSNPIAASIFDLYRDSLEERPLESIKYSPWAGGQFTAMAKRHMAMSMKFPGREPVYGIPYGGIENLGPENKIAVDIFVKDDPMMMYWKK